MSLSRVHVFTAGETLEASEQNAEFDNIINNPVPLLNLMANNPGGIVYLSGATSLTTTTAPSAGMTLIGTSGGIFTPAFLTAGANVTITPSSGGIEIAASTGGSITVQESDGSPSVTSVTEVNFNQTTGLAVTGGGGVATVAIGTVPVANGGTGIGTATSNGVVMGNVTGGFKVSAAGTANQVFRVGTSGTQGAFGQVNLASSAAVTGALATTNGGTGLTSTPADGQLLIGNGNGFTLANLTAGSGVTITNGDGAITIEAADVPFDPETTYEFYEEFDAYQITSDESTDFTCAYPWSAGGTVRPTRTGTAGGVLRVAANGSDKSAIVVTASDSAGGNISPAKDPNFRTRFAPVVNGSSTVNRYLGLTSASFAAGSPSNGIYLTWQGSASHIMAVCRSGGNQTYRDTGVTASHAAYHTYRLVVSSTGTLVTVVVDGSSVGTISTNIPTATLLISAGTSSNDAAVQGMDIDYIHVTADR